MAKKKQLRTEPYLNESPSVISMMAAVISPGGSIDSAVRYVADKGPANTSKLFRTVVNDIDCRKETDIRDSLYALASSLPNGLSSFRRALYMVISASETSDQAERAGMLREATDISLHGLRQTGEEYSSKLQTPCMVVFGLGIMVPMILLSIAPMLGMGSSIGMAMTVPQKLIEEIILIFVPAAVAAVILSIRGKNPLADASGSADGIWKCVPMFLAVPLYMMLPGYGFGQQTVIAMSLIIPSLCVLALVSPDIRKEKERQKIENGMKDAMFDLGNRLTAGENFESALVGALSVRKECRKTAEALSREYTICRGDFESAVRLCVEPVSKLMSDYFCDISRASEKNIRDAGRLATAIAHQLQDQDSVRKQIGNKLRNMTDMMNGTSAVFAPLILGMSLMMMGPLTSVSGGADPLQTFSVISVYLVELAVLMSLFTSLLACRFRATDIIYRFSLTVPAAIAILLACSCITI